MADQLGGAVLVDVVGGHVIVEVSAQAEKGQDSDPLGVFSITSEIVKCVRGRYIYLNGN